MAIKYLSKTAKAKLKGTAVVRMDLDGEGDWRIEKAWPTLELLLKQANKLVILGHKGRPEPSMLITEDNWEFSLESRVGNLEKLLGRKVRFIAHSRISEAANEIRNGEAGSVWMLENTRFLEGETENNAGLSRHLAALGDYFVNEAFGTCHRKHASVVGITKFLSSYAGLQLEQELKELSGVLKKPKKPVVVVLGGAKVKTKLPVIVNLRRKAEAFLVGGALANTILYMQGVKVGKSVYETGMDGGLLKVAGFSNVVPPRDYRKRGTAIMDIGPKAERDFLEYIKRAKTIIWNGPMGVIEKPEFAGGTKKIARAIARAKAKRIVGGGETVDLIRKLKLEDQYSFVSTGGGAMLDFLAGKKMPGVEALKSSK